MGRISNAGFGTRASGTREVKGKIICAFEGKNTEKNYLIALVDSLGKNNDYIFTYFPKDNIHGDSSNPQNLILQLIDYILGINNSFSYLSLLAFIKEIARNKKLLFDDKKIEKIVKRIASKSNNHLRFDVPEDDKKQILNKVLTYLKEHNSTLDYIESGQIINLVESLETYDPNHDKLLMIFDRDKKSLTRHKYYKILKKAKEFNINLYITNPCIEFWFLLSYDAVFSKKEMLKNNLDENDNTYAYNKLREYDKCYNKKDRPLNKYATETAINHSMKQIKKYTSNIHKLEHKLGSNMNELIDFLKETIGIN